MPQRIFASLLDAGGRDDGDRRHAFALLVDSSRIVSIRLAMVPSEIRPGIQPSQNSTANRADRGVAPQYQNGTRPPTGFGSIDTSWNVKLSSE